MSFYPKFPNSNNCLQIDESLILPVEYVLREKLFPDFYGNFAKFPRRKL
uniref:Uncharacterized protein n=1 Tax=viral metagenome TaxID=1070528 RepID=A0A6C0AFI7_9ZZZZ